MPEAKAKAAATNVEEGKCNFIFPGGPAKCFCQLAENPGCADDACVCPQGCDGKTWESSRAVTFKNLKQATGCSQPTALLTIPRSYIKHIDFLVEWCPAGMRSLLAELIAEGFKQYQEHVAAGPVRTCIHAALTVSQPWLHIHTFCPNGTVDGLKHTNDISWCSEMASPEVADDLAGKLIFWAMKGEAVVSKDYASCKSMGCNTAGPKPLCSCASSCGRSPDATACCDDFADVCEVGGESGSEG